MVLGVILTTSNNLSGNIDVDEKKAQVPFFWGQIGLNWTYRTFFFLGKGAAKDQAKGAEMGETIVHTWCEGRGTLSAG